jgi:putative tryptophan/tyrosine transport system substrate-binding protein
MKRRDFITLLGGAAAAGLLSVLAQQLSVPAIGYLSLGSPESDMVWLAGLPRSLNEGG